MPVAEAEDVADHARRRERADVGRPAVDPRLRVAALEPEHAVQVLARRVLERVLEDLDLLHERQVVVIGRHLPEKEEQSNVSRALVSG